MAMTLDDLQLLLDVANRGSFSKVAAIRGWSQPMVSQRIAVLEQELGQSLFRRHRRGATPTPACEQFLPAVTAALSALEGGRLAMQGAPALPRIRLSCLPSLTTAVFGPLLLALVDETFEIRCNTDHSGIIMQELLTGETDVGFILKCPAIAGIQLELLYRSPIIAVACATHPLAALTPELIAKYRDDRLAGLDRKDAKGKPAPKPRSPNTVRLDLALLGHLFNVAIKEWGIGLTYNPVQSIRRPAPSPGRWTASRTRPPKFWASSVRP